MTDTVLVTGIGGFIAKHVALTLLNAGFAVRGTVRSEDKARQVHHCLKMAGGDARKLSFVLADLTVDDGWEEAVAGCRYVQHVAAPFPQVQPSDREGLVPAARDGARRVLTAAVAAGAERIVMTSSIVAMMYRANRSRDFRFSEESWSDPDWSGASPYIVAKTRAELSAWELMREQGAEQRFTVVNPGLVLGPPLDGEYGTSLNAIAMLLQRKYPVVPPLAYPTVDVRDVARLHLKAMELRTTTGRRLIAAAETVSFLDIARHLKAELGPAGRKVPTAKLPAWAARAGAMFDRNLALIKPDIGLRPRADADYVTDLTGVTFRPALEAALASARSLIERGLV